MPASTRRSAHHPPPPPPQPEYTTPARSDDSSSSLLFLSSSSTKNPSLTTTIATTTGTFAEEHPNKVYPTVTPNDASSAGALAVAVAVAAAAETTTSSLSNKQVRFGGKEHEPASSEDNNNNDDDEEEHEEPESKTTKRGLVSRRGGRYHSPGRRGGTSSSSSLGTKKKDSSSHPPPPSPPVSPRVKEAPTTTTTTTIFLETAEPKNSVSFSPKPEVETDKKENTAPPTPNGLLNREETEAKTTRTSPGGELLEPNSPNRELLVHEEKKRDSGDDDDDNDKDSKPSPRRDREQFVTTPTNFALDYGKNQPVPSSFDTSHVLAWLQSPTANGLFSPGGYGSMLNTPRGAGGMGLRTPRTPTVTTSFFFSDAAKLPHGSDGSPSSRKNDKGNIICISPLASGGGGSGVRNDIVAGGGTGTPMNLQDVFNSPRGGGGGGGGEACSSSSSHLPMLSDTPLKRRPRVPPRSGSKDPSLDAVHMAERDLMEDEDLTVLLQLASNTTPRGPGGAVFRSPAGKNDGEKMPGLHLPMIGNNGDDDGLSKLKRKSDLGDFMPPQLGMRSSSSHGVKEVAVGGKLKDARVVGEAVQKGPPMASGPRGPYGMHMSHPGDMKPYFGVPPAGLPPGIPPGKGGSMRVVVGTQSGSGKSTSPIPRMGPGASPHQPPSMYNDYPPGMYPPPPHGMYSQYPPPPIGYPSYQSQYPPPPSSRPPYYGSHGSGLKPVKKHVKAGDLPQKRPHGLLDGVDRLDDRPPGAAKKQKSKSPGGAPKKKNRSPQITDKAERQKAAQRIHEVNAASGGKNDKAAALAAAILRGVTMRPSGKWQAQLYFAGKSRYIGVFDTREKAALAYEIAREKLKNGPKDSGSNPKSTENMVNLARKAAFDGVNEQLPP